MLIIITKVVAECENLMTNIHWAERKTVLARALTEEEWIRELVVGPLFLAR